MVECPKCGKEVSKRGLSGHKGSKNCKARSVKKEYEDKGWALVKSEKRANWIEENFDVEVEEGKYGYKSYRYYKGYYKYGYYAPEKMVQLAKRRVLPGSKTGRRWEKMDETKGYIVVKTEGPILHPEQFDDCEELFACYEKENVEQTRKRVFRTENRNFMRLYSNEGYLFGHLADEVPDDFISLSVQEGLKGKEIVTRSDMLDGN